jgi:hypothetical protein
MLLGSCHGSARIVGTFVTTSKDVMDRPGHAAAIKAARRVEMTYPGVSTTSSVVKK